MLYSFIIPNKLKNKRVISTLLLGVNTHNYQMIFKLSHDITVFRNCKLFYEKSPKSKFEYSELPPSILQKG